MNSFMQFNSYNTSLFTWFTELLGNFGVVEEIREVLGDYIRFFTQLKLLLNKK